ncbi:PHA/PHB synthase family protein [Rhizobacter sp. LjRoot28]|uniref:PHA/PHB synthase family protein n=1 Tax=Rhizobacter sp. LjRoot28 TaxID=3342309 RepID=UPI003ECF2617
MSASPNTSVPVPTGSDAAASALDAQVRAAIARFTGSLSPAAGLLAGTDWAVHLAVSPGKQMALARLALHQAEALSIYLRSCLSVSPGNAPCACADPPARDRRFDAPEWQRWPFNLWHQSFLLTQQWWDAATHGVSGVERHHENVVAFAARQWLDLFSPGNQLAANPVVLDRTVKEGGANLARGLLNFVDDVERLSSDAPVSGTENYIVGRDVAVTPGEVVLRNRLIELIQYRPSTPTVLAEPVLIVPAWIMKYYILDLSQTNSLIKYLVDHGHTVFCISWKNPGPPERDLQMDDYLQLGFHAALDAVAAIVPGRKVHATGYCLGGTLLAMAAAAMGRDGDDRLASVTLFAAQTDFSEPGELGLFIDESQLSMLEAQMEETGYLKASQMAGAFQMLRSYDLLWSRLVNEYLLGDRAPLSDLMAWNADTTRMPARMHSQYLRQLFLQDDLSESRHAVGGKPVSLSTLGVPVFMVGTVTDHVAPWRSTYKLHYLTGAEITFVLTSGGHNAGIVSPPGNPRRHYQLLKREAGAAYRSPEAWLAEAPDHQGSWWPAWQVWLAERSTAQAKPPRMGARGAPSLGSAPGTYVLEK